MCERCLRVGKDCVPHVPKIRSRRHKHSRRSLARIEQRIEALCQRIDQQPTVEGSTLIPDRQASCRAQPSAATNDWDIDTTNLLSSAQSHVATNHLGQQQGRIKPVTVSSHRAQLLPAYEQGCLELRKGAFRGRPLLPALSYPPALDKSLGQMLLDELGVRHEPSLEKIGPLQLLCTAKAELLLAVFRSMTFHFPVVFFPEGASCIDCVQKQPFVVLAMLVASSSSAHGTLQTACDYTFRSVLAREVIVEGRRNLELLQGLLIYLAWHHHYLRHETQQIYQYLQLAIGMVVDLGLSEPKARPRPLPTLSHPSQSPERPADEGFTPEEERALLGCYSLSCGLAVLGFDKPQNLAYTEHLQRCGQDLAEHGYYETDKDWLPLAELLHIAEQIKKRPGTTAETGAAMPLAHMRDAERQLQHWECQYLTGTRDHTRLRLAFHFVQIYLYAKAVSDRRSTRGQVVERADGALMDTPGAPMLLPSTLHATGAFLDDVLMKPVSLLRNMNIVEWTHLITAAITLARLARLGPEQTREAGMEHLQIKTQVEIYVAALCKRLSDSGVSNVEHDPACLFSWFQAIAHGIRLWVSDSDEAGELGNTEAKTPSQSTDSSAASTFETTKSVPSPAGLDHQERGTNEAHTPDRNDTGDVQVALGSGYEMVMDEGFWTVFISNWPHITVPPGTWKGRSM